MNSPLQVCPKCRDTGWEIRPVAEITIAVRCECQQRTKADKLSAQAQIPPRYQRCTFAAYQTRDLSQRIAKQSLETMVRLYPHTQGALLMGTPGVGKTHLAVAALHALIQQKRVPCLFVDFVAFLNLVQSTYSKKSDRVKEEIIRPVLTTDVVLIDDLGSFQTTAWVLDTMTYIINERYNHHKVTLLTTNWFDPDVQPRHETTLEERIGSRLRSRLCEMCQTIVIGGQDYRRQAS